MSIDLEYAIKKDIRNNPVVREVDASRSASSGGRCCSAGLIVGMLLFSAWQHFRIVASGYRIEELRDAAAPPRRRSTGKLRLELETLRRPQELEDRARRDAAACQRRPTKDTLVIERARRLRRPRDRRGTRAERLAHARLIARARARRNDPRSIRSTRRSAGRRRSNGSWRPAVECAAASSSLWPDSAVWAVAHRGAAGLAAGRSSTRSWPTRARQQQAASSRRRAIRGDIVDRHGAVLAYSVEAAHDRRRSRSEVKNRTPPRPRRCAARSATAPPSEIDGADRADSQGDGRLDRASARGARRLARAGRRASPALELHGIALIGRDPPLLPEARPGGARARVTSAARIAGTAGIEARLRQDHPRRGRPRARPDATRASSRCSTRVERAPTAGATLELTLDLPLQHIVERELKAGVERNRAAGGTAIVMDPHTGEILALANYPTFNPNAVRPRLRRRAPQSRGAGRLRARLDVQDRHRVGGDRRRRRARRPISSTAVPGYITFPGRKPITTTAHSYGVLSFEDVIVKSSNVGAIKVGLRVGAERLSRYVQRFGFGADACAGLRRREPRASGSPPASTTAGWRRCRWATRSASRRCRWRRPSSAVANGGLLIEPHVVRAVMRDGRREAIAPKVAAARHHARDRRDADDDHGRRRRARHGEGGAARRAIRSPARPARRTRSSNGRYSDTDYNASFVGFVPSRRPAFTILVVIDTPRAGTHYGGAVAAPIFKRIAEAALQQLGVPPTINPAPPVIVAARRPTPAGAVRARRRRRADADAGRRPAAHAGRARAERARGRARARAASG